MYKRLLEFLLIAISLAAPAVADTIAISENQNVADCTSGPSGTLQFGDDPIEHRTGTYKLTAVWEPNVINLIWNNGGHGTAPDQPNSCIYGQTFTTASAISDPQYQFQNWSVNNNEFNADTEIYCNSENLGVSEAGEYATLTANWNIVSCEIGQYVDQGTCQNCPFAYPNSEAGATSITDCYVERDPKCSQVKPYVPENCEVEWLGCSCDLQKYKVYSNATGNGDGNVVGNTTVWCEQDWTVVEAKQGYEYIASEKMCREKEFIIAYQCGDGVGGIPPQNSIAVYSRLVNIAGEPTNCRNSGQEFQGWSCWFGNDTTNTQTYAANATIGKWLYEEDMTCKAVWGPADYSVSYDCNISENETLKRDQASYHSGDVIDITNAEATYCSEGKTGYDLDKWVCDKGNLSGKILTMPSDDVICQAQWKPRTFTITYKAGNVNGVAVELPDIVRTVEYLGVKYTDDGTSLKTLSGNVFSVDGYEFESWQSDHNVSSGTGNNTTYNANAWITPYRVLGDTVMTANWKPAEYKVQYYVDGVLETRTNNPSTYNINTDQELNIPVRTGYVFDEKWHKCDDETVIVERLAGGNTGDLKLCIGMQEEEYHIHYVGCINGDCNDSIDLDSYVNPETLLTYVPSRATIFPVNNARVSQLDMESVNRDNDGGPYGFDNKWYRATSLTNTSLSYGTQPPTERGDLTVYTNLKKYYSVKYICGDNATGNAPIDNNEYTNEVGNNIVATPENAGDCNKEYYEFTKWKCGENEVDAGGTFTISEDTICEALWEEKTYSLNYECGVLEGSQEIIELSSGESITVADGANICDDSEGYDFNGWNCDQKLRVPMFAGENFYMPNADVTCVADWTPKEFKIIYTSNYFERENTEQVKYVKYNDNVYTDGTILNTLMKATFEAEPGYEFDKWESDHNVINGNSVETLYEANVSIAPYKVVGNTEMRALWKLKEYNVRYFINNVLDTTTGNPSTYNVNTNQELIVPNKPGYVFQESWYVCENQDDLISKLSDGRVGDLDLCIENKEEEYEIHYVGCVDGNCNNSIDLDTYVVDSNKLTYSVTNQTVFPTNEREIRINNIPNASYIFDGTWFDENNNLKSQTETTDTGTIIVHTNLIQYYKVEYACGEGTGTAPKDTNKYTNDNNVVTTLETPGSCVKEDYEFTKWKCGSGEVEAAGTFVISSDTTCEALWKEKSYSLTYDCDFANISETVDDLHKDDEVPMKDESFCGNNTGYEFTEWSCKTNGKLATPVDVLDNQVKMPAANVTCTAQWQIASYDVSYYCDSDSTEYAYKDSAKYNKQYSVKTSTVLNNACSHTGYQLEQWNCVVDSNNVSYNPNTRFVWKYSAAMDCYAQWTPKKYNIVYNPGTCGGGSYTENTLTFGETFEVRDISHSGMNVTVPSNYEFLGWSDNSEAIDASYVSNTEYGPWKNDDNLNLYGVCKEKEYHIHYVGCINGDCSNSIDLDSYVNPETLLTYVPSRATIFPVNNARVSQLDMESVNRDNDGGPYGFDNKWYRATSLTNTSLSYGTQPPTERGDLTVYTNLRKYYNVEYNCNGGIGNPQDNTPYVSGTQVETLNSGECEAPTGQSFKQWLCGDNSVNAGGSFTILSDTTCTAEWENNTYNVTYNCNGGKTVGSNESDSVEYGVEYTFGQYNNRCNNVGYEFVDWNCHENKNLSNTYTHNKNGQQDTIVWNLTDSLICDAEWNKKEYDIIYMRNIDDTDAEEISGLSPDKYSVTDRVTLPTTLDNTINVGYVFNGWSTNKNGTPTIIGWRAGQRTEDVVVYAQWKPNNYVIKYFGGMAGERSVTVTAMSDQKVYYGQTDVQLKTNTYAIMGYSFAGWECTATDAQGDSRTLVYDENEPHVIDSYNYLSDMICYAQWKPKTYDITYEVGNCAGSIYVDRGALTYDTAYSPLMPCDTNVSVQSMPGYEFKGWRTKNSTRPDRHAGRTYGPWTQNTGLTLYGVCEKVPYSVTYDCDSTDSNSVTPQDSGKYYFGDGVTTKANSCRKLGSTFDVWECYGVENSNITWTRSAGALFDMPGEDVLCKAKWNQNTYKVTYDCDGGTGAPVDSNDHTYNEFVNTLENTCEKTGYDFTKWVCAGADVMQNEGFYVQENTTCYAKWEPKKYDIIYNNGTCNGGTYTEHSLEFNRNFEIHDRSYPDMNISVDKGYEFLGWSTSAEANNVDYLPNTQYGPWTTNSDLSLYAVCKIKEYKITYNHNGGSFEDGINALTVYTVNTPDESLPVSYRNGYVFQGWFEDAGFQGNEITSVPDVFKANPHDVTLYARWSKSGKIKFVCPADFSATPGLVIDVDSVVGETVNAKNDDDCEMTQCTITKWQCGNNSREYAVDAPVAVADGILTCRALVSCLDDSHRIIYKVFSINEITGEKQEVYTVYNNDIETSVNDLTPNTYTTGNPVAYPVVSLPDHEFDGWFDNANFAGTNVTTTPVKPATQAGEDITVYGKMVYSAIYNITYHNDEGATYSDGYNPSVYTATTPVFTLHNPTRDNYQFKGWHLDSEDGQVITQISGDFRRDLDLYAEWEFVCDHWLHIGEGLNDKVCLYEERQSNSVPTIKIERTGEGNGYYYIMLSTDKDTKIHQGSNKKLHIRRRGRIYNVCDKSSCPGY